MASCDLKDKIYNGNCDLCSEREYCLLQEILEKLNQLEISIDEVSPEKVRF